MSPILCHVCAEWLDVVRYISQREAAAKGIPDVPGALPRAVCRSRPRERRRKRVPLCCALARRGYTSALEWAIERGYRIDEDTCAAASRGGRLCAPMRLRERGCPWDNSTPMAAAIAGHGDIVRWSVENGCPVNVLKVAAQCARSGDSHTLGLVWGTRPDGEKRREDWERVIISEAAAGGHVDLIKELREGRGFQWDSLTCASAARGGHIDALRWVGTSGCPWDAETCAGAVASEDSGCLAWVRETGCPWDERSCAEAALLGRVDILSELCEEGCPWDSSATAAAAKGGHLATLKWLTERGCPLLSSVTRNAARRGDLDALSWAVDQGCPVTWADVARCAALRGHLHVLEWMVRRSEGRGSEERTEGDDDETRGSKSDSLRGALERKVRFPLAPRRSRSPSRRYAISRCASRPPREET